MSLEEIKELNAYQLANRADCLCPDSLQSLGAKMLVSVRDSVVEAIENGSITLTDFDDSGQLHGITDNAPSIYTNERWAQFVDLGAYSEDPEFGEWPDDLTETAGVALYQIADRLAWALCQQWRDGWECPVCGDSGEPITCTPDECYGAEDDQDDRGTPTASAAEFMTEMRAYLDQDTPAEAVQTGPVSLDPIIDLIEDKERQEGEEAQIQAEGAPGARRIDALRIGHAIELSAWRVMVWTVAAILSAVGIVATVAVMS